MRAIVLAAGRGSRMGALGNDRPKCLVELAGKPLIERQTDALRRGGAEAIGVVTGYRAEMIDLPALVRFQNPRWAETNMVMSLAAAAEWLESGTVVVSYADIFYPATLVRELSAAPGDIVVAYDRNWRTLWSQRFADPLLDAETFRVDASGRLLEIGQRTRDIEAIKGQYMGLLKFTPNGWREVALEISSLDAMGRDRLDMTSLLSRLLGRGVVITTTPTQGGWGEIDSVSDLELYERMH